MTFLGLALKLMELSSMMQLILASALWASAGKGSPGVQEWLMLLNCMNEMGIVARTLTVLQASGFLFSI